MSEQPQQLFIQRSSMLNGINNVGKALRFLGMNPFRLNSEVITRTAAKRAGWKGEVPASAVAGLERLVASINDESNPNPFGELAVKGLLERTMYGRLKVEQHIQAHPEILDEKIKEPVFIIGMPRTGTSILHALMHEDPAHRSPLAWECLLPYPVPKPDSYTDNSQLNTIRKEFGQLFKLVPDFQQKHYMEADSPQECIGVNAMDFNTFMFSAQLYLPSYMQWFENEADRLSTMQWHKKFLQYLQSGGVKGQRWLLKSPVHLMRLPEIFEVYPDARIIMTHRDPLKVVGSTASLMSSVRSLYSDREDAFRTGSEQAATWSRYFMKFLESRKALDKDHQIIDLKFSDFIQDQVGLVGQIYERFGWELSEEALHKFETFINENPKDKHGVHSYMLEDFGLSEAEISKMYQPYIEFLKTL